MKPQPTVGVRELRARLSAYLRSVSNGASITIRDRRHRPVARLVPIKAARGPVKIGGLKTLTPVPDDFNTMFEREIEALFAGTSTAGRRRK